MNNNRRTRLHSNPDSGDYAVRHPSPSASGDYITSSESWATSSTTSTEVSQGEEWRSREGLSNWHLSYVGPDIQYEMACPLYAFNPQRYWRCASLPQPFRTTAAIREHVSTVHRRPYYCPACGTTFRSASSSNRHIQEQSCSVREMPSGDIEGIPEDNMARLNRWSPQRSQSEEERWYSMWDILFPGVQGPSTPFLVREPARRGV
ncbi:hypothetical protein QBC38DRAFT_17904 [Podospora fimiseda]|uniref:C2H2-type domain-containing protein n=1 Tax=Podospora fimiseda TaxID=252190 RepID=A0AAN7GZS5_9PEZI|nr:hypothetical protein QBC38DRAFT_17904 [Podospora fimiseda]